MPEVVWLAPFCSAGPVIEVEGRPVEVLLFQRTPAAKSKNASTTPMTIKAMLMTRSRFIRVLSRERDLPRRLITDACKTP